MLITNTWQLLKVRLPAMAIVAASVGILGCEEGQTAPVAGENADISKENELFQEEPSNKESGQNADMSKKNELFQEEPSNKESE